MRSEATLFSDFVRQLRRLVRLTITETIYKVLIYIQTSFRDFGISTISDTTSKDSRITIYILIPIIDFRNRTFHSTIIDFRNENFSATASFKDFGYMIYYVTKTLVQHDSSDDIPKLDGSTVSLKARWIHSLAQSKLDDPSLARRRLARDLRLPEREFQRKQAVHRLYIVL